MKSIEEVTAKLYEIDPAGLTRVGCPQDEYYTEAVLIMITKDVLTAENVRDIFYDMFDDIVPYDISQWQIDFVKWFNQEES